MSGSRAPVGPWQKMMAVALMLPALISMTGCGGRFVVVDGEEVVTVKKSTLDHLYVDNELLLQALEECRKQ